MYDNWEELEESIKGCNKCKLCNGRQNIVFGTENRNAKLMFIGEGPGADEDRLRRTICWTSRKVNELSFPSSRIEKRRGIYRKYCKV